MFLIEDFLRNQKLYFSFFLNVFQAIYVLRLLGVSNLNFIFKKIIKVFIRVHQSPNSRCSKIVKIFSVWTVRYSCCSLEMGCSSCSVFGLFAQNELLGLFAVRTVRSERTVRSVRCLDCSFKTNCSACSTFELFGQNEVFGPVRCSDGSSCSSCPLFGLFVKL